MAAHHFILVSVCKIARALPTEIDNASSNSQRVLAGSRSSFTTDSLPSENVKFQCKN